MSDIELHCTIFFFLPFFSFVLQTARHEYIHIHGCINRCILCVSCFALCFLHSCVSLNSASADVWPPFCNVIHSSVPLPCRTKVEMYCPVDPFQPLALNTAAVSRQRMQDHGNCARTHTHTHRLTVKISLMFDAVTFDCFWPRDTPHVPFTIHI